MKSLTEYIVNESFLNKILGFGKQIGFSVRSYCFGLLTAYVKKNPDDADRYGIVPNNIKYDEKKQIVYYYDYENCNAAFIHNLKDGIILKNVPNHMGSDSDIKKVCDMVDKTVFGRELASLKKQADANRQWSEDFSKQPDVKYRRNEGEDGLKMVKDKADGTTAYGFMVLDKDDKDLIKKYYFVKKQDAMEAEKYFSKYKWFVKQSTKQITI